MRKSSFRPRYSIPLLALLLGASACVRTPEARLREQVEVTRRETDPALLLERARALRAMGDLTRAEQYLKLALANGGEPRKILPELVGICVADERYRAAAEYVKDHLRRHPAEHQLRFLLASLYVGLEEKELARSELERVLLALPSHAEAHFTLGLLYRDTIGDAERADEHFRNYLVLKPSGSHADEARGSLLTRLP
jgi:tetratricopeptide (TPR) repeat protein